MSVLGRAGTPKETGRLSEAPGVALFVRGQRWMLLNASYAQSQSTAPKEASGHSAPVSPVIILSVDGTFSFLLE